MTDTASDRLEGKLLEMAEMKDGNLFNNGDLLAALARAVLAYRDYVHKDKDTEAIDDELRSRLGVK